MGSEPEFGVRIIFRTRFSYGIAAEMKMVMIPTILMVAYLATNILSKTYLVETVSKDHGYGVLRQHSGSDYGNDYNWKPTGPHWWSTDCPVYINEAGGRQQCEQIRYGLWMDVYKPVDCDTCPQWPNTTTPVDETNSVLQREAK